MLVTISQIGDLPCHVKDNYNITDREVRIHAIFTTETETEGREKTGAGVKGTMSKKYSA